MVSTGNETVKRVDIDWIDQLAAWFLADHRELPWRDLKSPNPYHVWISEIMLQQTRVEAVRGYFARFMERLPDIPTLAEVPEDELMKLWEGLGYYSRAKNIKKCAAKLMADYAGKLPEEREDLLKLPGIGPYTAGAIASIAYHKPEPAVDGNVLRVMARIFADDADIMQETTKKKWRDYLAATLKQTRRDPSVVNQALMELGAMVCVPNGVPDCAACPLEGICQARKQQNMKDYPVKTAAKKRKTEQRLVLLICCKDRVLLHKRPSKGLLADLYEFPNFLTEDTEDPGKCLEQGVSFTNDLWQSDLVIRKKAMGERAVHIFSHIEWHMQGLELRVDTMKQLGEDWVWSDLSQFTTKYAVPGAFAAYKKRINSLLSEETNG